MLFTCRVKIYINLVVIFLNVVKRIIIMLVKIVEKLRKN